MKKYIALPLCLLSVLLCLTGCGGSGSKTTSLSVVYAITMAISLLLLGYALFERKRDIWLLMLFACVMVVNIGYFTLSLSRDLSEALLANRISYLGSVFLPLFMMIGIWKELRFSYPKWLPGVLMAVGVLVFLIAASPGYLEIYYKEVSFVIRDGAGCLQKVYGPWHALYPIYLLGYFTAMVVCIVRAIRKGFASGLPAVMLAGTVLINIAVWLMEQFVSLEFEMLSVSYILSELFLICLGLLREQEREVSCEAAAEASACAEPLQTGMGKEEAASFARALETLTKTERVIFEYYMQGASTKEIMAELNIKENTLKFHNKNIYGKFGVSSRKELAALHRSYSTR